MTFIKRILISLVVTLAFSLSISLGAVETRTLNNGQLVLQDIPEVPKSIIQDLNRYQNVRSAGFDAWTQDGKSLLVSTRFGDVGQLHRLDMAGGARHQLTFFKEPIGQVAMQPKGQSLAFSMDAGGSEYAQLFTMDLKSGAYQMITDGKSRNGAMQWSADGRKLAYQSTKRNGRSNDLWIATFNDQNEPEHEIALESPDGSWWGPVAFDKDAKQLLVQQYVSSTQSIVHVKNLHTDQLTKIAGDENKQSRNYATNFDSSGKGVFLTTDRYGQFTQLIYRDIASGKETIITDNIDWDVQGVTFSRDKSRAAFVINEDGLSRLYLLDTKTFKYHPVKNLPIGVVGNMEFDPSNTRLAMSINTPKSPTDTFVLELKNNPLNSGQLVRWTFSEVGGLNTQNFVEPELIHYPSFDKVGNNQRQIPAFVYKPKGQGPFPVIISIHGGPEGQYRPRFSGTYQMWLEKLGVAVIAPNVRGSSGYGKEYVALDNGFKREDSVKDIGALLDWIKAQPDLDQERVAVFGGSYGGYMVLASAVHYSDRLKAAVDIVGISNFVTFLTNTKSYRRDLRRVEYGDERDQKMREYLEKISPSNNVSKIKVPLFVVQGENDPRVPVTEAVQIVKALRDENVTVWYMNALNEGHGYRKKENRDVYQQAVILFMQRHLL